MSYNELTFVFERMSLLILTSVTYGVSVSFLWITKKLKLKKLRIMFAVSGILSVASMAYLAWNLLLIYAKARQQFF